MKRLAVFALVLASTLASCSRTDNGYQGWIEANLIFVAPDEVGRVQTLAVREGDSIKAGQPLFTVDDDLQQADLAQVKAALANAQQSFDRAQQLAKTGSGTQKDLDTATAPGQYQSAVFYTGACARSDRLWRYSQGALRRLRPRYHGSRQLYRQTIGIHAAGNLQPRGTLEAGFSGRGVTGQA